MFEFLRLLGGNEQSIALQTRMGHDIPNAVGPAITAQHHKRFKLLIEKHGSSWIVRKEPTPGYNCAGHVWACRRTSIYELASAWSLIVTDDGYRQTQHPQPDDLVFYVDGGDEILHVGRIVELRPGVSVESERIPWAVSKWSDWAGEVLHNVFDHPYRPTFDVTVEYWTDRPARD